jgi:outer membrane protein assembly factor BamB
MRRHVSKALVGHAWVLLCAAIAAAQSGPPVIFIQPSQVLLPIGQSQPFQLLQLDGNERPSSEWTVSDPKIAELTIESGRATVTGMAAGHVTLLNGSAREAAEIDIRDAQPPMPQDSRWILRPIDGQFVHVLWASGTWGGSIAGADTSEDADIPAYFYEDRGPNGSHVRAIRKDGLQTWQWPDSFSSESPRMICGDVLGGALVQIGDQQSRTLVDLDAAGHERWRAAAPGFNGKDFTYTMAGMFYFLEEHPNMTGARIVGLDAHDGRQTFAFDLPATRESLRGLALRNGELICSPGAENSVPLPSRHSRILSNAERVANLAYSEFELVADGGNCAADSVVTPMQVHVEVTQRLVMVDIHEDQTASTRTVEENTAKGAADSTWIRATVPTGDIIPGEQGTGNFLAVRRTLQLWRGTGPGTIEEFQYRITEDRNVKYRVPVPLSPLGVSSGMLLGEDLGYTTRGNVVIAFDVETGREIWRWASSKSNVQACAALQGDKVLVHEGNEYTIVKDGKPEEHLPEDYMLFVFKFRPDWANF